MQKEHTVIYSSTDAMSLVRMARLPVFRVPAQDCPCCCEWAGRIRDRAVSTFADPSTSDEVICMQPLDFKHHLASHLEHLALFAVPIPSVHPDDDASNAAIEQASSVGSDDVKRLQRNARLVAMDFEHDVFDSSNPKPFNQIESLGWGVAAKVDEVICTLDSEKYALKQIPIVMSYRHQHRARLRIKNEIAILKKLKHNHVIPYLGSFIEKTKPRYESICVLFPAADTDFTQYLDEITSSHFLEFRSYFGCFITALKYLHDQKIRHNDIKPSNVLVNHGNVLLSGFGQAFDFTGEQLDEYGTTEGMSSYTLRYGAPEAIDMEFSSTQSDIWNLGAVFFCMFVALKGKTIDDVCGGSGWTFNEIADSLPMHFEALREIGDATDNLLIEYIQPML